MSNKKNKIENITQFKMPEQSPGYLLWHVSSMWRSFIEDTLKPFNITHPQFVVLTSIAWLTRGGNQISQVDVSFATGLDPNTISQILRGLEKKQLIKRARMLNDRSKNPVLSPQGSEILAQALPAVEQADTFFFELLSSKEQKTLFELFGKLISVKNG